jgi:hypothetical protein
MGRTRNTTLALAVVLAVALGAAAGVAVGSLTARARTKTVITRRTVVSVRSRTVRIPTKTVTVAQRTIISVPSPNPSAGKTANGKVTAPANPGHLPDCKVAPPPCLKALHP